MIVVYISFSSGHNILNKSIFHLVIYLIEDTESIKRMVLLLWFSRFHS